MDEWKIELTQEAIEDPQGTMQALIEAANNISADSQQDFQALKDTRWYKRLWNLITFSKDNEKKLARGVVNLAKLQEIVMKALLLLVGHSAETAEIAKQNSIVLGELSKKLSVTKNAQVGIIRELERIRSGVSTSLSFDEISRDTKLIIVNALLRIKDALPVKSDLGEEYLSAMMNATHCTSSDIQSSINYEHIVNFENKESQLIYSMVMEYIFLSTGNFECDSEIVRYINVGPQKREAICTQIKCIAALRDGEKLLFNRFKDDEDYSFVAEGDIEWFFYEDDCFEEIEAEEIPQKEDVYITSLTQIRTGESLKFIDKNVYVQANIDCHGELLFLNCKVFYNCGDALGKVTLSPGSQFNVWNSHVECCAYDDTAFVRGRETEIYCMNSTFHKCSRFIEVSASEVTIDRCGVYNCIRNFVSAGDSPDCSVENALVVIDDLDAVAEEIAYQKEHKGAFLPHVFDIDWCDYSNNLFYCPIEFNASLGLTVFWGKRHVVESCTFITLGHQSIHYSYSPKTIRNSLFVGGSSVISMDGGGELMTSMFINCENAVERSCNKINSCYFIDCYGPTIRNSISGEAIIDNCIFLNTKYIPKPEKTHWLIDTLSCIHVGCNIGIMGKGYNKPNEIRNCLFHGLTQYENIIAPDGGYSKPEDTIAIIDSCRFINCDCINTIKTDVVYHSEILNIKKTAKNVMQIINCEGVSNKNWFRESTQYFSKEMADIELSGKQWGCDFLHSDFYMEHNLNTDERITPWIKDYEARVISETK